jgi:hypothetical protein
MLRFRPAYTLVGVVFDKVVLRSSSDLHTSGLFKYLQDVLPRQRLGKMGATVRVSIEVTTGANVVLLVGYIASL